MSSHWNRREFLKNSSTATLAALAAGAPLAGLLSGCNSSKIKATADTVILLWMAGGMAHAQNELLSSLALPMQELIFP